MPGRLRLQVNAGRQGTDGTLVVAIPDPEDVDAVTVVETTRNPNPASVEIGAGLWLDAVFTWSKWRRG